MAQKKSANGGAVADPVEDAYRFCIKQTAFDIDTLSIQTQDGKMRTLVLVAES